ncbi:MAG: hypothetical protein BWY04_01176 [candidate division CPR1 bacterium ADurb.Bin160]|uniref:Uncharacterized protein n=1 Tax=candidate division CPR1 bacterium ADurb.Bin160 TaxID=1852826 RepID=A0A1V5ZKV2_9BACT|nr:MAG: hypothetical protein BWY04_01176 [candidate division CPR1 bacterium ADurb.Bin160]
MDNCLNLNIAYHNQTFRKGIMEVPFKIVFQTSSKSIEKYCKENYPKLMTYSNYSMQDNVDLQKMRAYIKVNLGTEINEIHNYFYKNNLLNPFNIKDNLTKIKIDRCDCKINTNPDIPFLELNGIISFDYDKMLKIYSEKKYIKAIKIDKQITKINIKFKITKPYPYILTYRNSLAFKTDFLNLFKNYVNATKTNAVQKLIEKEFNLDGIQNYKKNISWSDNNILIEINDVSKLLKIKVKENILPITGGYLLLRGK